jgi:hypothetical protein
MPDVYNTEGPEHLHIEYAKVLWRASNKVKPLPQMITFIQCQNAIRIHGAYLDQYLVGDGDEDMGAPYDTKDVDDGEDETVKGVKLACDEHEVEPVDPEAVYYPNPSHHMAATPTVKKVTIQEVINQYHASNLIPAITSFLTLCYNVPPHDTRVSPNNYVGLWHKLSLCHPPPSFAPFDPVRRNVICASPPTRGNPANWDVALYIERPNRQRESDFFVLV